MKLIYIAIALTALVYDPVDASPWLGRKKQSEMQQTQEKQYRSIGGYNDGPVEGGRLTRNALKWYGLPTAQNGGVFIQSQEAAVVMCWTKAPDAKISEMKVKFNTNHGIRGAKVEAGEVKVSPLTAQKLKQIQDAYVKNYEGFSKALIPDQVRKLLTDSSNGVTINDQDAQTGGDMSGLSGGNGEGESEFASRSQQRSMRGNPNGPDSGLEQNQFYQDEQGYSDAYDQRLQGSNPSRHGGTTGGHSSTGFQRSDEYGPQDGDLNQEQWGSQVDTESSAEDMYSYSDSDQYAAYPSSAPNEVGFFKRSTDGKDGGMLFNVPKNYMAKTKSGEPICYAVEFTVPGDIKPSHQAQLIVFRERAMKNKNLHSPQFNIVAKPQFPENLIIGRNSHQGEGSGSQTRSLQDSGSKSDKQYNSQAKDGIASFWTKLFGGEKKQ
ncbi:hypothetical protein MIR68_007130 [Amoeboaphelidium protococcarum]|nr:hypothetical protein MIR68_007130 [Amoeboaphelidium protococcarum]